MRFFNPIYLKPLKLPDQDKLDYVRQALMAPRHCVLDRTKNLVMQGESLTFNKCDDDFETLVEKRTAEIVSKAKAQKKQIRIFWSGGIASSAVVHALSNFDVDVDVVTPHEFDLDNLFTSGHMPANLKCVPCMGRSFELLFKDSTYLNVTGIGSHNFSLPTSCPTIMEGDEGAKPWQDVLKDKMQIDKLQAILHEFPISITNMREMLWAFSIAMLYNHYKYVTTFNVAGGKSVFDSTEHFFLTQKFQDFGTSNPHLINLPRSEVLTYYLSGQTNYRAPNRQEEFVFRFRNDAIFMNDDFSYVSMEDYMRANYG